MASKLARLVSSTTFALLVSLSACKTDLEDLPDVDPVDDPWVEAIASEEEPGAAASAIAPTPADPSSALAINDANAPVDPTLAPLDPTLAPLDPTLAPLDPAAGTVDPGTTEAAKLAGASVPSSNKAGETTKASPSADPSSNQVAPLDPAAGAAEPAPVELQPAAEPAPAAAPAKPAAPPPITMADYDGTFRFSGGSKQEQLVADAIEFGAQQVVAIARGIARKRLTKTQIIEDPVTITVTGDNLKLEWGSSGDSMSCVIDGPTTTMSYKGDKYKGRARAKDGKLITSFQGPDATKTVVYVLSSDRKTMTVHHKLVADQLQEPVTFKLTYTRK